MDILQPDSANTCGIMEAKKIAATDEGWGIRIAPHVCGSPLATQVALHLAANLPNFAIQELYPYFRFRDGYFDTIVETPEAAVRDGYLALPAGSDLGATLNRTTLAPFLWDRVSR